MTSEFVPLGPPATRPSRCIVCGLEADVPTYVLDRAARSSLDGRFQSRTSDDEPWASALWPDGRVAVSCASHTPDEVRTAFVLTEWKLREDE